MNEAMVLVTPLPSMFTGASVGFSGFLTLSIGEAVELRLQNFDSG